MRPSPAVADLMARSTAVLAYGYGMSEELADSLAVALWADPALRPLLQQHAPVEFLTAPDGESVVPEAER